MKCGTAEELAKVREFYIELLGLKVIREWAEGMMIDTGNGLLEIFTNADELTALVQFDIWPFLLMMMAWLSVTDRLESRLSFIWRDNHDE